jgi:Tol biopolymer transport system component
MMAQRIVTVVDRWPNRVVVCLMVLVVAVLSAKPAAAAFPGMNGKIVFAKAGGPGAGEIWAMNEGGSEQTRLTKGESAGAGRNRSPTFSPDGTRIAFVSDREGNSDVFIMDADGSHQQNLTNHDREDGEPTFSPDGLHIAFTRAMGRSDDWMRRNDEVFTMDVHGNHQTRLTHNTDYTGDDNSPVYTPDGRSIIFVSTRPGCAPLQPEYPELGYSCASPKIREMFSNGTGQVRLTSTKDQHESEPDVSPDGIRIVFADGGMVVMNRDGTGVKRLIGPDRDLGMVGDPVFSPDGSRIAFTSNTVGHREVYTMKASGAAEQRLTFDQYEDWHPDWGPVISTGRGAPPPGTSGTKPAACPVGTSASVRCLGDTTARMIMVGTDLSEKFVGTSGPDQITMFGGTDVAKAGSGADHVDGGAGKDQAAGSDGDDVLMGGGEDDKLSGGDGNDQVYGGVGMDLLLGGAGDDLLSGGAGNDRLFCGAGVDRSDSGTGTNSVNSDCERRPKRRKARPMR